MQRSLTDAQLTGAELTATGACAHAARALVDQACLFV